MEQYFEIIQVLSQPEKDQVRRQLRKKSGSGQRLNLFNLIESKKVSTDSEAAFLLYKTKPNSAYSHLKARLMESVLDVIFPVNEPSGFDPHFRRKFQCWRNILIGQFLLSREAFHAAAKHLEEARKMAEKYNLSAEILIVEDLQIQHFSMIPEDLSASTEEDDKLIFRMGMIRQSLEVKKQFVEIFRQDLFQNLNPEQIPDSAINFSDGFKKCLKGNAFPRLKYWYLQVMTIHQRISGNIAESLKTGQALWDLTQKNVEAFSVLEMLDASLAYAKIAFIARNYHLAVTLAGSILKKAPKGSLVELNALEIKFLNHFYAWEFSDAEEILQVGKEHPKLGLSKFHLAVWEFYEAHLEFVRGNYSGSLRLLRENQELMKYKSKWLLGHKVLEIYNLISLQHFDLVEFKLNALKQLLKRQKEFNISRGKYVAYVLTCLVRNGFDFRATRISLQSLDSSRIRGEEDAEWVPFNFEVFQVEQYLRFGEISGSRRSSLPSGNYWLFQVRETPMG